MSKSSIFYVVNLGAPYAIPHCHKILTSILSRVEAPLA